MDKSRTCEDDRAAWYGVGDLRVRKRVQDRLAQRARRKRLSDASNDSAKASVTALSKRSSPEDNTYAGREVVPSGFPKPLEGLPSPTVTAVSVRATNHRSIPIRPRPGNYPPMECKNQPMVDPTTRVIMALHCNGLSLGLCCNYDFEIIRSRPQPTTSPAPAILHPSPLQCAVPHFDWIDRFPFPRFRDNAILMAGSVDLADFVSDFYTTKSIAVREDGCPWDPCAWMVHPGFLAKWGFLFSQSKQ